MTEPQATSTALPIADASQVGEARRAATALAGRLGFDETERGKAALIATEAATNLLKHAGGGLLILRGLECGRLGGLEVLALDKGPGMADVGRCLADGFSTAGSPGHGLGAIGRLASTFDLDSHVGAGTALLARLWPPATHGHRPPSSGAASTLGAVSVPYPGEQECGDAWASRERDGRTLLLVVDGLGHGPQAAEAARVAVRVFQERGEQGPEELVRAAHDALRSTRGAALAVAETDPDRGQVRFCGLGNISGTIVPPDGGRTQSLMSHNGTAGHEMRKVQGFTQPWPAGASLVLHSDGLSTHWRLDRYPGLATRHPSLIAGVLYRDFNRGRDDATVVVVREGGECPG